MKARRYDIFISYRRDTGQQYARILQMALERIGYRVFLDYDEIKDGVFGDNIREAVLDAPIFMPVLSSQYLTRCKNEGDWVREEIMLAIQHGKHFIPVNPDGKHDGIPGDIPEEIVRVISDNQHSEILLGKMLPATLKLMVDERIRPHVKPRKRFWSKNSGLVVLAVTVVLAVAAVLLYNHCQDVAQREQAFGQCKTKAQYEDFIRLYPNTTEARLAADSLTEMERLRNNRKAFVCNTRDDEVLDKQTIAVKWDRDITLSQLRAIVDLFDRMMLVQASGQTFTMGKDDDRFPYDRPQHQVTLTRDYYICQFETTRYWWYAVMNDSVVSDRPDHPISDVTWQEAKDFCRRLKNLTDISFTLPTEAQWEYAARGNEDYTYSGSNDADEVAWYKDNSDGTLHPVGQKDCNARDFQLYDMSGNVSEWCLDNMTLYSAQLQTDPLFTTESPRAKAVTRGGSMETLEGYLDLRHRDPQDPVLKNHNIGFRVVFNKP